jgi:glutathione S-transferase
MEWLNYVATEIHKNFSPLFAVDRWMPTDEGKNQLRSAAKANLDTRLKWLNGQIAPGQYLMGQDFCAADAYLYTCLRWSKAMSIDMTAYPNLMGYVEKLQSRPAVQKVLKDEGLA